VDRNGIWEPSVDQVAKHWPVYLDQNNNQLRDSNEPTVFTDSEGNYAFGNLGDRNQIFNNFPIPPKVQTKGDINVGSDVWFGESVTVMSGVTIGHGAVVATNSHVFKDVEPYSIVGGNPAKLIKYRFDKEIIDAFLEMKWWDLPDEKINEILPLLQQEPTMEIINEMNRIIRGEN
jgi:acetyltransferase-like isoleucine patch superfamily enzyme